MASKNDTNSSKAQSLGSITGPTNAEMKGINAESICGDRINQKVINARVHPSIIEAGHANLDNLGRANAEFFHRDWSGFRPQSAQETKRGGDKEAFHRRRCFTESAADLSSFDSPGRRTLRSSQLLDGKGKEAATGP